VTDAIPFGDRQNVAPRAAHLAIRFGWGLLYLFAGISAATGGIAPAPRTFQAAYLIGCVGYFLVVAALTRSAPGTTFGRWRWWLLGAVVLRIIPLATLPSDDTYRYVWEGRVQQAGKNPYVTPPDDPSLVELRDEDWKKIGHPHFPAIYPPLAQLEFRLAAAMYPSTYTVKALHVLWDALAVALLAMVLKARGARPHLAAVYGLCPLVLTAFAVEGHVDSAMLLLAVAAIWAFETKRAGLAGIALGSAIAAKTVVVVLLLWFVLRAWRVAVIAVIVVVLWYLPFGSSGLDGLANLRRFGEMSEFFSFLGSLKVLDLDTNTGRMIAVAICAVAVAIASIRCRDVARSASLSLGAVVLTLPVVHFWYLTWVLVFVPLAFRWTWPVAAAACVLYFEASARAARTGAWLMPAWTSVVVWLVLLATWLVAGVGHRARGREV